MRRVVAWVLLVMASCTAAPGPGTGDVYAFPAEEDAAFCKRATGPGYPDPETLAQAYVTRDGAGTLYARGGNWLRGHHACPGRPAPGWDIVTVVSEARIDSVTVEGPMATAYVGYHRLGYAHGNPAGFTEALTDTMEVFKMVRLADGWWLNSASPPHPLASDILAHPNFDWPDSLRILIERLATK